MRDGIPDTRVGERAILSGAGADGVKFPARIGAEAGPGRHSAMEAAADAVTGNRE
jgi:hypothetical protein